MLAWSVVTLVDLFATSSFASIAVCCAVDTGLFASEVLSTFPSQRSVFVVPCGFPVACECVYAVSQFPELSVRIDIVATHAATVCFKIPEVNAPRFIWFVSRQSLETRTYAHDPIFVSSAACRSV